MDIGEAMVAAPATDVAAALDMDMAPAVAACAAFTRRSFRTKSRYTHPML